MSNKAFELIAEHHRLDDFIKAETKRFADHLAQHRKRLDEITIELQTLMQEQGVDSFKKKGLGTAYMSKLLNVTVEDAEKALDFALDNWEGVGSNMVKVSPSIPSMREYMEEHNGQLPPGLKSSWYQRVNVRRT